MTEITKDLIGNQTMSISSAGYEAERVFMVSVAGNVADTKLYNAINSDGIPKFGDPHPILPDVKVTRVTAAPPSNMNTNQIQVVVNYAIPVADDESADTNPDETVSGSVSLNTSLATEQTFFDINGDFLTVTWKGSALVKVYKNADVQRPTISVTFRRIETQLPKNAILNFLGKVNSGPWSGFPKKTWLCTQVDCTEEKEGKFNVDYGFSYREDSWRLEVIANLNAEQIQELPPNTETANGYQLYDVYKSADFNTLGLSF